MKKRIVIALGGNAIKQAHELGTAKEQRENVWNSCHQIIKIVQAGHEIVLTHGNGPQVGNLLIQQEAGYPQVPSQPMDICGAMTQGQLGYMLQQNLVSELKSNNRNINVVAIITQTIVDREDPDFKNPSKPVGPFYDQKTKKKYESEKGYHIKKVLPNGEKAFRRVVPSPDPIRILEGKSLKRLVDSEMIVIASGGGGIPVILNEHGQFEGIEGVVDKDLAAEKLAEAVDADILLILTDVNKVRLGFGTPDERNLDRMNVIQAKGYLEEGHFLTGSMAPKVLACIRFIEYGGEKSIIASMDNAFLAIENKEGTQIVP